jgi:lipid-A-disaccharide synthase
MGVRVAVFAGEASGDLLAASLITAIAERSPGSEFFGIAGEAMQRAGCSTLYPLERLSVMGLVEAVGRYRELIPVRSRLVKQLIADPPDVVIGVDAPDFNLGLERRVRAAGIPTVHYVSPAVWAWRRYRIRKIRRSVDLMLTLFPFEAEFYREHHVRAEFVGHPLADEIDLQTSREHARASLGLPPGGELVALLPGSRTSEVAFLAEPLVRTAVWLAERRPGVRFLVPLVSERTRRQFEQAARAHGAELEFLVYERAARACMAAADAVIVASGTATLEAMLLEKPMVITYRATALTYWLMERWIGSNVRFAGLPNLLADRLLVPELMQDKAAAQWLGPLVLRLLEAPERFERTRREFAGIHETLRMGASARAASAVLGLLGGPAYRSCAVHAPAPTHGSGGII